MVITCRDLALYYGRNPTEEELLKFLEVEPNGMTRTHINYVTRCTSTSPAKDGIIEYIIGEPPIKRMLRETKQSIGRIERFLIEGGLIDRTPRGRRLTDLGIQHAEWYISQGKAASNVA